jgi:uncharacterized protein with HEPN domain
MWGRRGLKQDRIHDVHHGRDGEKEGLQQGRILAVMPADRNLNQDLSAIQRLADRHGVRVLSFNEPSPETLGASNPTVWLEVETPEGQSRLGAAEFLLELEEQLGRPVQMFHRAGNGLEPIENLYLHGILGGIARVRALPVRDAMTLLSDRKLREAVVRELRLIGELAYRLPRTFLERYPDVDWDALLRFRGFLVLDNLDMWEIWEILREELPVLAFRIWAVVDQPDDGNPP